MHKMFIVVVQGDCTLISGFVLIDIVHGHHSTTLSVYQDE